jgi:hypothetical protein
MERMNLQRKIIAGGLLMCLVTAAHGEATNACPFPFVVYSDYIPGKLKGVPSGWMGDYRDLTLNMNWKENPHSGETCIRFTYNAKGSRYCDMAGVMWQNPANNSGEIDGGLNLTGASNVTFWARGEKGKELIDAFTFGGTIGPYPDSDKASLTYVRLKPEWVQYSIDISRCDLTYISSFFGWIAARFNNREGFTIYLDDIQVE